MGMKGAPLPGDIAYSCPIHQAQDGTIQQSIAGELPWITHSAELAYQCEVDEKISRTWRLLWPFSMPCSVVS